MFPAHTSDSPAHIFTAPEDSIIHTRITNDEKALRRVTKKFHNYTSVAYDAVVPLSAATSGSVDDARDAFLVELASFHLSLKKSLMVCEAEARQVEEYQREKERIGESGDLVYEWCKSDLFRTREGASKGPD